MRKRTATAAKRRRGAGRAALALLLVALAAPGGALAAPGQARTAPREAPNPPLVIGTLAFTGNTRTPASLALLATGLQAGDPASPGAIYAAADRLRDSRLFRQVEVHTRPGSRPGLVDVVFSVKENRPHLRFGVGYEDLTGWYLIPVQLNLDNLTGHGEILRLSTRLGYRLSGLVLSLRRSLAGSDGTFWELRLRGESQDRIYFHEGTEIRHRVSKGGADLRLGHRIAPPWLAEVWAARETADPDSAATVYRRNEAQGQEPGDEIPLEDLPLEIQDDLADREQTRLGLALSLEATRGAGLRMRGLRGRVSGEGVFSSSGDFGLARVDLRGYLPIAGQLQLALRLRASAVSSRAPFYERFYLGGLYTVRGYPSQSLSPPHGNLNIVTTSIEVRSVWIGPAENPRLVSLAFLDLGAGGNEGLRGLTERAAGLGYGIRWRLPWIGRVGLDLGHPLSPSPVEEQFHLNLSLGWTY